MKKIKWLLILVLMTDLSLQAQTSATFIESGKAIRGYDPVAYFTRGKAVKGSDQFVYQWNNANWHFSSKENMELFKAHPEKYAPQYGGYCAFGLSRGYKAPTAADAWTIDNGKLYLNYNLKVREEWNKERQQRIDKADKNWSGIKDK